MSIIYTPFEQSCFLKPLETMYTHGDWMHINAFTAEEVLRQTEYVDHQKLRLCVYADEENLFIDSEGSAELCRLLYQKKKIHRTDRLMIPVLPCDYSICLLASNLQIECVEVMLGHPILENGIQRPKITQQIVSDLTPKVIAGGIFTEEETSTLQSWGCIGVQQYRREVV